MKIRFDQGPPAPLRRALTGHEVSTAYQMGWAYFENDDLLLAAGKAFSGFIPPDKNLRYQQSFTGRQLAILVLPNTSWPRLQKHLPEIIAPWKRLNPVMTSN